MIQKNSKSESGQLPSQLASKRKKRAVCVDNFPSILHRVETKQDGRVPPAYFPSCSFVKDTFQKVENVLFFEKYFFTNFIIFANLKSSGFSEKKILN